MRHAWETHEPPRLFQALEFSYRIRTALETARGTLLAARTSDGHWVGELSSSALSTATAITALAVVDRESDHAPRPTPHAFHIERGLAWLARNVNADGGWGDTTRSLSNISTTTLCWAAFGATPGADQKHREVIRGAERWLRQHAGGIGAGDLEPAILRRYGRDRTFSVPILTMCVLSGRLGRGPEAWRRVLPLPFELAALPQQFFAALRLPVVSYALPALIAIGQARHYHLPTRNPLTRVARNLARRRTLDVLETIQPSSGGFLEATPLTSFVVMSLAGCGQVDHPVTRKGIEFLIASARDDGSWPIDTNLSTWVTTLSVNALAGSAAAASAASGEPPEVPSALGLTNSDCETLMSWLLDQQNRQVHPYTRAAPGGWAWTDLTGGVPDADDTAGALLALKNLAAVCLPERGYRIPFPSSHERRGPGEGSSFGTDGTVRAALAGIKWLLRLQNRDGGIPTFCRGWTNLPFDRSSPDLTAHAVRAWLAWRRELPPDLQRRVGRAIARAMDFLARSQRADGSWVPLWFGNQHAANDENPTFGTARVLAALAGFAFDTESDATTGRLESSVLHSATLPALETMVQRGVNWLGDNQKPDGSWSGCANGPSSIEETALAIEALAGLAGPYSQVESRPPCSAWDARAACQAAMRGADWLIGQIENGQWLRPSPIGFYFARLWYYESLYPVIFTAGALTRVARIAKDMVSGQE
jgi:squalene-hopene/tetraprenyl-beta-curcumene cyclase